MRILLATDGSESSKVAMRALLERPWPPNAEVLILSVAHPLPDVKDPLMIAQACHIDSEKWEHRRATQVVKEFADNMIRVSPSLHVATHVAQGSPKEEIVKQAEQWHADLVMLGSHGHGPVGRFLLGSVAASVAIHAPCSVEIVRDSR
jgi:nucleotide-binding universal stress UspA family protein